MKYNETTFVALDKIIAYCAELKLKLLLVLTNFWPDYGGMKQYVTWSPDLVQDQRVEGPPDASSFYVDQWCQETFEHFIKTVLTRKNTKNGLCYYEDPTILGWSPANEPRCTKDPKCKQSIIPHWADRIARFIKSIDSNHLVFMDTEGFYGPSTPAFIKYNPFDTSQYGCYFAQDCRSPYIDVCCFHLYPDTWLPETITKKEQRKFIARWISSHVRMAKTLQKPLLLAEFGAKSSLEMAEVRENMYLDIITECLDHIESKSNLIGFIFWMAAAAQYEYDDGFTITMGGHQPLIKDPNHDVVDPSIIGDYTREIIIEACICLRKGSLNRLKTMRSMKSFKLQDSRGVHEKLPSEAHKALSDMCSIQ